MAEEMSLSEHVYNAINEWMSANDNGVVVSALFVMDCIDGDGSPSFRLWETPGQHPAQSLGLVEYAKVYYGEQARSEIMPIVYADLEDDDE